MKEVALKFNLAVWTLSAQNSSPYLECACLCEWKREDKGKKKEIACKREIKDS